MKHNKNGSNSRRANLQDYHSKRHAPLRGNFPIIALHSLWYDCAITVSERRGRNIGPGAEDFPEGLTIWRDWRITGAIAKRVLVSIVFLAGLRRA